MIKLSNLQASRLVSPAMQELLNKPFPVKDCFLLSNALNVISNQLKTFFDEQRKVILENNGTIAPDGKVTYQITDDARKAQKDLNLLNEIELEYNVEALTLKESWPNLTLVEIEILKPILVQENT